MKLLTLTESWSEGLASQKAENSKEWLKSWHKEKPSHWGRDRQPKEAASLPPSQARDVFVGGGALLTG